MNEADIRCFLKVAELQSFSKAAEALFMSQQSVSQHIHRLEREYRTVLFERKPSVKLTESGQLLRSAALEIIVREQMLFDQLASNHTDQRGEISIGMPNNRASAFAAEFIPQFSKRYPNMTVSILEHSSSNLPTMIRRNEVDLALPLLFDDAIVADSFLYHIVPLGREDLYMLISNSLLADLFPDRYPQCIEEMLNGVHIRDFYRAPMFLRPSSSILHEEIVSIIKREGFEPLIRIKTSITANMLSLCAQGYGIFFCPPLLIRHLSDTQPDLFEKVQRFPVLDFAGRRRTVLLYHRDKYLSAPLRFGIEIIRQIYGSTQFFP